MSTEKSCPPNWKLYTYAQDQSFQSPQNAEVLKHLVESTDCECHWTVNALTRRPAPESRRMGTATAANSDQALAEPTVNAPAAQA